MQDPPRNGDLKVPKLAQQQQEPDTHTGLRHIFKHQLHCVACVPIGSSAMHALAYPPLIRQLLQLLSLGHLGPVACDLDSCKHHAAQVSWFRIKDLVLFTVKRPWSTRLAGAMSALQKLANQYNHHMYAAAPYICTQHSELPIRNSPRDSTTPLTATCGFLMCRRTPCTVWYSAKISCTSLSATDSSSLCGCPSMTA